MDKQNESLQEGPTDKPTEHISKSFALLKSDQIYDEVHMRYVERWKESHLSGDEWRFSWSIEFLRKGKVMRTATTGGFDVQEALVTALALDQKMPDAPLDLELDGSVCMQPGCAEPASVIYKCKAEYSRNRYRLDPLEGFVYLRAFCARHKHRGDCGMDDSDSNYEVWEDIEKEPTNER